MAAELGTQTEDAIKEAAKTLFFTKGRISATTKEIADAAGINRALIHYYFRSRDLLFDLVLKEEINYMTNTVNQILSSKEPIRFKINHFLNVFLARMSKYPYLENFIVAELSQNPEKVSLFCPGILNKCMEIINKQLKEEIKAGSIKPIKIEHFIVNLMSLCNYPMISKPIITSVFGFDEKGYLKFLQERKKVIYRTIFNEDPPD